MNSAVLANRILKKDYKIPNVYVDKIKNENLSKEQLDIIIQMIYNSLDRKAGKEAVQELIKKMKERKGVNIMSAFEEYLDSLFDKDK